MAEIEFIEEAAELGIQITPAEATILTEELTLMQQNMITTGEVFKLKLADLITGLETRGMTNEQVLNVLLDDLENDGAIFGGLKRGLLGNADTLVDASGQRLDAEEFRKADKKERLTWTAILVNTCEDCITRHGITKTFDQWKALGLPTTGWSVCKSHCKCQLFPAEISESKAELQLPMKRVKGKITQIAREKKKDGEIKSIPKYVNRKLGSIHNTKDPIRKQYRKLLPGFKR